MPQYVRKATQKGDGATVCQKGNTEGGWCHSMSERQHKRGGGGVPQYVKKETQKGRWCHSMSERIQRKHRRGDGAIVGQKSNTEWGMLTHSRSER